MIDSIYHIISRGIIIGILVSAPMGPIGLLCVQRTLYKGRWHGFFSGVGAACSDFLYAMITCLGMGIVVNFIESYSMILQFAGSILFMIFGIYIFRSNPSENFHEPKGSRSYWQDLLTAFLVTLSNPLIIFWLIALLARFNFIHPDYKMYSMFLGMVSIFAGALLWWFVITSIMGKLRGVFNKRGLVIMNRTVGVVILVLSIYGVIVCIKDYYYLHV